MDVEFDDFEDFEFMQYKDVRIHSMEIYENGPFICGMEVYYIVDGEILKYTSHHKTKKAQKIGAHSRAILPPSALDKKGAFNLSDLSSLEKYIFKKTPIYFKSTENIIRVRV